MKASVQVRKFRTITRANQVKVTDVHALISF
jgi:hypothetical protein